MKTNTLVFSTLACIALASISQTAIAAPGDLDFTFGGTGKVTTVIGSGNGWGNSVALQADGRIVVAGVSSNGNDYDISVVRYNANGSLDTSFNGTGNVTTSFGASYDYGNGAALQSDGKIVVAGYSQTGNDQDFAVVRYNANGSLDTSFNGTGKVTTDFGSNNDYGSSLALQSDGKIVVAGQSKVGSATDFAVVRYNTNGTLDTSFNGTGKVTTPIGSSEDGGRSVAIQPDGKIVVAGHSYNGTHYDFAVVRYNSDGSRDSNFNGNGKVTTDFSGSHDYGSSVAVQSDGKIVVAGSSGAGSNQKFAVARYNSNGSLDTTFNGTGMVTTSVNINGNYCNSTVVQGDGKIVAAGYSGSYPNDDLTLIRYNSNGSLDTTFNGIGKVTTSFAGNSGSRAASLTIQGDGNIVAVGVAYNATSDVFALARFQGGAPSPEIAVEQPAGTDLVDGTASITFGGVLAGSSASRTFTIKNIGGSSLTGLGIAFDGTNAGDFAVTTNATTPLSAGGSATFSVRFAPTIVGTETAVLHIASNDSDENPFKINLTGKGLAPSADDDGDGLPNAAEVNLAACGFDPLVNDIARLAFLRANGLYQASDMETLALGNPVLAKDAATGRFHLSIRIEKSVNLSIWTSLIGFTPTYDELTGRINLDIVPDGSNAQFYRVLGAKP